MDGLASNLSNPSEYVKCIVTAHVCVNVDTQFWIHVQATCWLNMQLRHLSLEGHPATPIAMAQEPYQETIVGAIIMLDVNRLPKWTFASVWQQSGADAEPASRS